MRNTRLWFPIATATLLIGLGTACQKGQAAPGPDPGPRPPPARNHQFVVRRAIPIASGDAARRKSALALFDSTSLGLENESADARRADANTALKALTDTFVRLPRALEKTFGHETAQKVLNNLEVKTPKCLHSACVLDVYYRDWTAFDGLNQLIANDTDLPWSNYNGTQYRSGREELKDGRFAVTWALVFPLKSIDDEQAERANAAKNRKGVVQ